MIFIYVATMSYALFIFACLKQHAVYKNLYVYKWSYMLYTLTE